MPESLTGMLRITAYEIPERPTMTLRFALEDTDFRLLCEKSDGTGQSLQFDAFQVVFDGYNMQLRINLTGRQVECLSAWGWEKKETLP
jgi:hypothetical protein